MTMAHLTCPFPSHPRTGPRTSATATALAKFLVTGLAAFLVDCLDALDAGLARRAHARAVEALPMDLRKDLGWPAGDMPQDTRG